MLWLKKKRDQCPTLHVRQNDPSESLWRRTFLPSSAVHHGVNYARYRGNGVRPTSCPFQVPSTRFWSKQTANFLEKLTRMPELHPNLCQLAQWLAGNYSDFRWLSSIPRSPIRQISALADQDSPDRNVACQRFWLVRPRNIVILPRERNSLLPWN